MKKMVLAAWIALCFPLIAGAEEPAPSQPPAGQDRQQSAPADQPRDQDCGKDGNADECGSGHFSLKGPKISFEGAQMEGDLTPWLPKLPKVEGIGLWAGPMFDMEFLDLGNWLEPLTDSLEIKNFDDNLIPLGLQVELAFDDEFVVGGYFEDGFQTDEHRKDGENRQASVNLMKFGGLGQIQIPVVSKTRWENWASQIKVSDTRVLPPEPPKFIAGSRFGGAVISLSRYVEDDHDLWTGTEWFLNVNPYAGIMIPLHKYVRVQGVVGYDYFKPVSGIRDYSQHDQLTVSGKELGGFYLGGGILFGAQSEPKK